MLGTADVKINSEVNITPSPARDDVNVILGKYTKATVTIYDASGKFIKTVNVDASSNKIDVSELVKGVYVFNVVLNDTTKITKKIVKE